MNNQELDLNLDPSERNSCRVNRCTCTHYTLILQQFNFKDASLPKGAVSFAETLYNLILQPLYTVRYAAVSISIESGIVLYLFEIQENCF